VTHEQSRFTEAVKVGLDREENKKDNPERFSNKIDYTFSNIALQEKFLKAVNTSTISFQGIIRLYNWPE